MGYNVDEIEGSWHVAKCWRVFPCELPIIILCSISTLAWKMWVFPIESVVLWPRLNQGTLRVKFADVVASTKLSCWNKVPNLRNVNQQNQRVTNAETEGYYVTHKTHFPQTAENFQITLVHPCNIHSFCITVFRLCAYLTCKLGLALCTYYDDSPRQIPGHILALFRYVGCTYM
jgi:hypothetical protein